MIKWNEGRSEDKDALVDTHLREESGAYEEVTPRGSRLRQLPCLENEFPKEKGVEGTWLKSPYVIINNK
jgi:hypothetical protein